MIRVLIVDNSDVEATSLARQLTKQSEGQVHTVVAKATIEALRIVRKSAVPFDAFLIDQHVDGSEGIAVMQSLLQISPDTEAIIFTEATDLAVGLRAYQAGANYQVKPPDPTALVWQLRSIYGLRILNDAAHKAQKALSFREVADAVTNGAHQLGFERVHLWVLSEAGKQFEEISRAGTIQVPPPIGLIPVALSPYARKMMGSPHELLLFRGEEELGPSYYTTHHPAYRPPAGTWAMLALRTGGSAVALLILDNDQERREIHAGQCRMLRAFGRQAAAALERARLHEQLQQLTQIGGRVTRQAAEGDLDKLLLKIKEQIGQVTQVRNFQVALVEEDDGGPYLHYRLRYESGRPQPPVWRRMSGRDVAEFVVRQNRPIRAPDGEVFRRQHRIGGGTVAKSFVSVPLRIKGRAFGAIIVEDRQRTNAFTHYHLSQLKRIVRHIEGAIHLARLEEDQAHLSQSLSVLQRASEEIARMADEKGDDYVWHVALTAATASYGLQFNRAVVFRTEAGGRLRGCASIGHIDRDLARADWEQDERDGMSFDSYLARLRANDLPATPLQEATRDWLLDAGPQGSAFEQVLTTGRARRVGARRARAMLPEAFLQRMGVAEYAVLPLHAGREVIGLVVLDNIHDGKPIRRRAISHLEPLLAQAAITIENLHHRRARESLIDVTNRVLSEVNRKPLGDVLSQICQAIRIVARVDGAVIYPLATQSTESSSPEFDEVEAGQAGWGLDGLHPARLHMGTLAAAIIRRDTPKSDWVVDLSKDSRRFDNLRIADLPLIHQQNMTHMRGRAIHASTGELVGAMALFYRQPPALDAEDDRLIDAFAGLASTAILDAHTTEQLRAETAQAEAAVERREQELMLHRSVLGEALKPGTNEERVIACLLDSARRLTEISDVHVELVLRVWRRESAASEPSERRIEYRPDPASSRGGVIVHDEPNLYRGVIGRVFADGKYRCADDVRDGRWPDYYGNPHTRSELVVPIKPSPDAELIGAFVFESPVRAAFSADVVARIERLAGVAALALDNIRRQARANAVLDATRTVAEPIAAKATFAAVERVLREAVPDLSTLALWHLTPSGKFRLGAQFGADDELPVGTENDAETVTIRRVIESELPIFATNARLQSPDSTFIERQGIKSFAAFPLRAQDHNVGAMFLNFRHVREFSTDEKHVLSALAAIVAASIRDALMVDRLEMQADWLKAAQDVGEAVGTTNTLQDVLHKIMTKLKELYPEAQVCIYTYQPGNAQLTVAPASMDFYHFDHIEQTRELDVRTEGTSIASRVARQTLDSRKIEVENVRYSPGDPDFLSGTAGMQSELCASLVAGDGQLLGTLILESPKRNAFVDDDVEKIRGIARQISLSIERSKLAGQLRSSTALAAKIAWAADIAHDIEPQIEAIRTRLMWLQEEMAGSQVARQLVCEIDESAAMLDRAAQNAAFFDFEASEVFGIDDYLRDEIMSIVHGKPTVNINVVWRLSCPSARVQVNRASLYGIVSHLVRNAIEAMGREGVLTVHSFERPNWVEVHIEDSGHGLESKVRDQIFLHSVSTKRIGHSRRGNGLLIAQLLAEQMKGSIRLIRSESGVGTTFGFNLPIAK